MKLTQVKGNTWVIEANQFIPLYRLPENRCILLDSGLREEREALEETLLQAGLTPAGILCSHAHIDHCANNGYLQEKYGIPVALTAPEAGMCSNLLTLKCYMLMLTPKMVEQDLGAMVHTPDVVIPSQDGPFSFTGVEFQIIQTPGHSPGHICTVTPDHVCYTADALLSWEMMQAKLPYSLNHQLAWESREKLRALDCDAFIMAHQGVCTELEPMIQANHDLTLLRAGEIRQLVQDWMTASQIVHGACQHFKLLSRHPRRALRFERNIRFFIEFLVDRGELAMEVRDGITMYRNTQQKALR